MKANLLYQPNFEHDGCGTGFVVDISGRPSYSILDQAVQCVVNLTHRGAVDADAKTGDGAGILTQIPRKLFDKVLTMWEGRVPEAGDLGIGVFFFPSNNPTHAKDAELIAERVISDSGLDLLGWRDVPIDKSVLGDKALASLPVIRQLLVARSEKLKKGDFERALYLVRKQIEQETAKKGITDFYIPSFSSRTIVYKGLLVAPQLKKFYKDLSNPDYETAIAMFHQRYSTNTFPNWFLAQPFRLIGHNGEINTLQGNRNWMRAREEDLRKRGQTPLKGSDPFFSIVEPEGSDSASLDNVLESLLMAGRDILHAITMMVPEAWQNASDMNAAWRAYYEYHGCLMEPWDGPAALTFTDGKIVGATLDRNGLRPARYIITKDNIMIMGSEVGMVHVPESNIKLKGRLGPGKIVAVDTEKKIVLFDEEIKNSLSAMKPYREWVENNIKKINGQVKELKLNGAAGAKDELTKQQIAFGYNSEELTMILRPMAETAKDPVGSMGDDTPLAVLSEKPRLLYTYFKQLFAQVTNPAIDPIREERVMSLVTYLGERKNVFEETPEHARVIELANPCLLKEELELIRSFGSVTISCLWDAKRGQAPEGPGPFLQQAVQDICAQAEKAVDAGAKIIILSDKGVNASKVNIPMLLAVSAVHHHLIRKGKRMRASLIAEVGEARELHHFAALIGYGASAVCPYLAYDSIASMTESKEIKELPYDKCVRNFKNSVNEGLLKIMSKMGVSTISSYHGGQIFEAIGINSDLIDECFTNTASRVGGIGYEDIARDQLYWHSLAYGTNPLGKLDIGGFYRYRGGGEYHAFNPDMIKALHKFVRSGEKKDYNEYAGFVNNRPPISFRDILKFKPLGKPIPLDYVEPVVSITKRFNTPGMSLGALSKETHETLAIAMNRIGAKSDSGEGGEDKSRYKPYANGDWANSKIKQVASGRFGVTIEYLSSAEELEIKIAQGSKPGEGGQLPGHKVSEEIARLRHATPGVTLISPPPHHDIYSIEDLAQLIYDLKQANPKAKIIVKLVAEAGVGTIAAGVAKAHADIILISGHDGGTGASPLSSIKNAGSPWEIGIAEAQQVLVLNDLRGRIRLRTDGGFKSGRDVVMAALFGAEEYGFGTAALVAAGCCMVRQCHLNTCPVGVATQDEKLRAKYAGSADMVVNFFNGIAQEVREILASIGARSLDEIIGRTDLLELKSPEMNPKIQKLDLSRLLAQADPEGTRARRQMQERNDWEHDTPLDLELIRGAKSAIEKRQPVKIKNTVRNIHRSVGTRLSHEIAKRYGDEGFPAGTVEVELTGTAGQSFGAFALNGLRMILRGEANDYVGKGLCGGEIIITPSKDATFESHKNVILGNTVMYGATSGSLFAAGRAGERFCVRNSGATAVVEGAGDHCCEYMTNGVVLVLGETGRNFGAGMTGGVGYVLDENNVFEQRYNPQLVRIARLDGEDEKKVKALIEKHVQFTGSRYGEQILRKWDTAKTRFWKIFPHPTESKIKSELAVNVNKLDRHEKPDVWVDPLASKK